MNNTLKIDAIRNELVRYVGTQPKAFQSAVLSNEITINRLAKTITKVKGHYPSVQALMSHVVQIFDSKTFTPYGDIQFMKKDLKNYHQKVDFVLDPAEILGSIYEDSYDEATNPLQQKSISKMAIQMLKNKVIDDVNILSISGVYDATKAGLAAPVFGASMNGLNKIHEIITADTDNPVFSIPGNAITSANILDEVTEFERQIPTLIKPRVKKIIMSLNDAENYQIAYEDRFGQNKFQNNAMRTRLGNREIIGIPHLTSGTIIATVEGNFLRLIDEIDNPATITSIQVHDRILKVLGEFSLGYDYAINQLVFMHTVDGSKKRGLNNADQNKLIYPSENLIV